MAERCVEHLALAVSSCHLKARTLPRPDLAHDALQRSIDGRQWTQGVAVALESDSERFSLPTFLHLGS